jgi:glycosyltransferase involved in cell wall biosynthesis
VTFTGFVEDPHEPLRAADVFVLATEYEGFGNVIVEALSEGLPVVVSDVPYGPGFILDEGRYGTLATPGSVEALAEALTAAIERAPLDDGSAEAARARASSFALERVADRFEKLVDVVASGQPVVPASYREWQ